MRVSRKVFLKHQVNWNTDCGAIQDLPWRYIWLADNPVEVLNEHLSLLVGRNIPTKVIRVRNKNNPWFDDQCRHAFDLKQEAHLRWTRGRSRVNWEELVRCQVRANETYSEAKRQFSDRRRAVLMNVQTPHKWCSTLKYSVFGTSSSLPPLVNEGGGLVRESVGKADLLSDHFDSKQSTEAVDLSLTCHPSRIFTTFAFRSRRSGVSCLTWTLMMALTHWVCFVFFHRRTADVMVPPAVLAEGFGGLFVWVVSRLAGDRPMSPQFRKVTVILCCQLPTDFYNISIV